MTQKVLDMSLRTGLLFGLIGVISFSLTLPMIRIAVIGMDPTQITVWRAFVAALASIVILSLLRPSRPRGQEWRDLAFCALGTVFGFPLFTTLAMQTVSASHGAVVIGLLPISTAVCGTFISDERPSFAFWMMSLLGTVLTVAFVLRQSDGQLEFGHLYLGCAVLSAGMGYSFGGRLAKRLKGWVVACWSLIVALPVILVALAFVTPLSFESTPAVLGAFFYLALISQLGGFFAWYKGLALAGIARVSQLQLMQLFLTVGFAIVFLGEAWTMEVFFFGAAVAATVWATSKLLIRRKRPAENEKH